MLTPRQELIRIERQIYRQNQATIEDSVDVPDADYNRYLKHYNRTVKIYKRAATLAEVLEDLSKSRVALFGDYHTLDQSQRSFVRFLRHFFKKYHKDIIVGLEKIQARHQKDLDAYMCGEIDEKNLVKRVGYKKHWFFDLWDNYAVIFDFLKYHAIPTFGLDASGAEKKGLGARDKFMAKRTVELAKKNPEKILFVLVGDLHLAPKHLPRDVEREAAAAKVQLPLTILFQNSPEIYWRLSQDEALDHTLVVKLAESTYCRMHTPPIIVQQSYINWLYHDEGRFDWFDARLSFVSIVQRLCKVLDIPVPVDHEHIEVYTCGDLSFLKLKEFKEKFSKSELKFIHDQLLNSESYFMSKGRVVYIANVSINHAAEEASHYLKFLLTGAEKPRTQRDAFYANILHEAIGFFGSKLINSKRKCAGLRDFKNELGFLKNAGLRQKRHVEFETAALFIDHKRGEKVGKLFHTNRIAPLSGRLFLAITHALGYDLGEHLYYGFMEGSVKKDEVRDLYQNPFVGEGETGDAYLSLVKKLRGVKRPRHM